MGCPTEAIIDGNLTFSIATHDPDTGIVTDADSDPTFRVYEDDTGAAIQTGTMSKHDNRTGFYLRKITCTTALGYENGKTYTIWIEATVDGDKGGIPFTFTAKTNPLSLGTIAELTGIADAPATPTPAQALMLLYQWLRNNTQATATERRILNDAGTEIMDAAMSDDGTTFQQGKLTAP